MLVFVGDLLEVQTGEYNSLVFRSTKYDIGLKENVPCSVSVGISEETQEFIGNYRKHIGEKIAVGVVALVTKKSSVFYLSQTDVLDFSEVV